MLKGGFSENREEAILKMEKQNLEKTVGNNDYSGLTTAWNFAKKAILPVILSTAIGYQAGCATKSMIKPQPIDGIVWTNPSDSNANILKIMDKREKEKSQKPGVEVIGFDEPAAKPVTANIIPLQKEIQPQPVAEAKQIMMPEAITRAAYMKAGSAENVCIPLENLILCTRGKGVKALGLIATPDPSSIPRYNFSVLSGKFNTSKLDAKTLASMPKDVTATIGKDISLADVINNVVENVTREKAAAILYGLHPELANYNCDTPYENGKVQRIACKTPLKGVTTSTGYVPFSNLNGEGLVEINMKLLRPEIKEKLVAAAIAQGKNYSCNELNAMKLACKNGKKSKETAKAVEYARPVTGAGRDIKWKETFGDSGIRLGFGFFNDDEKGDIVYAPDGQPTIVVPYENFMAGTDFNALGEIIAKVNKPLTIHLIGGFGYKYGDGNQNGTELDRYERSRVQVGAGVGYKGLVLEGLLDKVGSEQRNLLADGTALSEDRSEKGFVGRLSWLSPKGLLGSRDAQLAFSYGRRTGDADQKVENAGMQPIEASMDLTHEAYKFLGEIKQGIGKHAKIGLRAGYERVEDKLKSAPTPDSSGQNFQRNSEDLLGALLLQYGPVILNVNGKKIWIDMHEQNIEPRNAYQIGAGVELEFGSRSRYRSE